jgi:lysozyme family protein
MIMLDQVLDDILVREQGFVNDPADKGGPTKWGITAKTLGYWRQFGRDASAAEVAALEPWEAKLIYRHEYVTLPGFAVFLDRPSLLGVLADSAVLHSPFRAIQFLQRALGVKVDGVLGPVTIAAAQAQEPRELAVRCLMARLRYTGRRITDDLDDADKDGVPDNTEFAAGWINRIALQVEGLIA